MIPRMERQDKRLVDQLRPISFETGIAPNATASVLVTFGRTKVICAVTIEEDVPRWMKVQRVEGGWQEWPAPAWAGTERRFHTRNSRTEPA